MPAEVLTTKMRPAGFCCAVWTCICSPQRHACAEHARMCIIQESPAGSLHRLCRVLTSASPNVDAKELLPHPKHLGADQTIAEQCCKRHAVLVLRSTDADEPPAVRSNQDPTNNTHEIVERVNHSGLVQVCISTTLARCEHSACHSCCSFRNVPMQL